MNIQNLYSLALVGHIVGLTMLAGTTLADYTIFKKFWQQFSIDKSKAIAIRDSISKLPVLMGIGILLIIVSGVAMMGITHGAFGEQLWFRIKFGLVLLIIINAVAVGRRLASRLGKTLADDAAGNSVEARLLKVKSNLNVYHLLQLGILLVIFVLSVFKFN